MHRHRSHDKHVIEVLLIIMCPFTSSLFLPPFLLLLPSSSSSSSLPYSLPPFLPPLLPPPSPPSLSPPLSLLLNRFNFTIMEGNNASYFSLGDQTGVLDLVHPLNSSTQDCFLLTIVAQNSEFSCHRGRVSIEIKVIRERVEIPDLDPVSVSENAQIGTEITCVRAINENVTYSLIGGNGVFNINSTSGCITLISMLDFETLDEYSLTIVATSTLTGNTGSAILVVRVLDENEEPFFITTSCPLQMMGGCGFILLENLPDNASVGLLMASDEDSLSLPNGELTFDLLDDGVPFTLIQNGCDVLIHATETIDREMNATFTFRVRVMDGGTPSLSSMTTVTIVIGDENDNAPIVLSSIFTTVSESTDNGSVVILYTASDPDAGSNAEIMFSISPLQPGEIPFQINPDDGTIKLINQLDFEMTRSYAFLAIASNPDGLSSETTIVILVGDVNDNGPIFSQDTYFGSVKEGTDIGYTILTVNATDIELGLNGAITFSIEDGNVGDSLIILMAANNQLGSVTVNGDIDREKIQMFNLTIRVRDLGFPSMSDTATVLINVTDINDNRPIFTRENYQVVIREDSMFPSDILTISAFDIDQPETPNSDVVFSLDPATNIGEAFDLVPVDNNTATFRLVAPLNFENISFYQVQVVASDLGDPPMTNEAVISIQVTDFNEFTPIISGNQTIDVSEGEEIGTVIAQVNGTDGDMGMLNFSINSVLDDGGVVGSMGDMLFDINLTTGEVTLGGQLDSESSASFVLEIGVSDGVTTSVSFLVVNVLDVNEFSPIIEELTFLLFEEEPSQTLVGRVLSSDNDMSSVLTYSIVADNLVSTLFTIDPLNGDIFTSQVLDREMLAELNLFSSSTEFIRVEVSDGARDTIGSIGVTLLDINDNAPTFQGFSATVSIPENEGSGVFLVNAMATDRDLGSNGLISYSITEENLFSIDSSGVVRTSSSLDSETTSSYTLTLTASDSGQSQLSTNSTLVVVVEDVNDNTPIFPNTSYEVTVPENTSVSTVLLSVTATDADISEPNNAIRYTIESSGSGNLFSINDMSEITLDGQLDFELVETHILNVTARDLGSPELTSTVQVIVTVSNVDEVPPQFISDNCSLSIIEFDDPLFINTPIGSCFASDIDEISGDFLFNVPLIYEILGGNIRDTFRVDGDGAIIVTQTVDRELLDVYSILLRASDPAGLSSEMLFTITIIDVNDNPPVILNAPTAPITITEDEILSQQTSFFTVEATDADAGLNSELTFTLDGVMVLPDGLSIDITVVVSDGGTPDPQTSSTVITFNFDSPCLLQDHMIDQSNGRITSLFLCDVNLAPTSLNLAVGETLDLTCSAVSNLDVSYQFLHNSSVVAEDAGPNLVVAAAPFQSSGEYECIGRSEELGNFQSNTAVVTILGMYVAIEM